jgi:hypothetical protein
VTEKEKCRVKIYQDAANSLKVLQEFAVQWNDSDMLNVISQAKVFVESRAAKRVNCVQKLCLNSGKIIKSESCNFFLFNVMVACVQ